MKRIVSLLLTIITLLSCVAVLSACDEADDGKGPPLTFEKLDVRPIEEIEASGITASDVLAVYDAFAKKIYTLYFEPGTSKLDAQFTSISSMTREVMRKEYTYEDVSCPYYMIHDNFPNPPHFWLADENSPYYKSDVTQLTNIVITNFNYAGTTDTYSENVSITQFGISKVAFSKVMDSFNVPCKTIERNEALESDFIELLDDVGENLYEAFVIDRKVIKNANEEQLWALYNMVDSMVAVNLENYNPDDVTEGNTSNNEVLP